jgi:DNA adenine methylase
MKFSSPLRYPGGKRKIAKFVADAIISNEIENGIYIEPFAGGASIAIDLLNNKIVN